MTVSNEGPWSMFFLLRCAFWLGLVFVNMDWTSREPLLPTPAEVAAQATSRCLADPALCSRVLDGVQTLSTASVALTVGPPKPAAKPSADSLAHDDRIPPWRGRGP
jgi:hypothetical protein